MSRKFDPDGTDETADWERLEAALDAIEEGIIVINKDYKLLYANKSAFKASGEKAKKILGRKCFEVIFDASKPCDWCKCDECFESGRPHYTRVSVPMDSEGIRHFDIYSYPSFDHGPAVCRMVEVTRDVTEKVMLESQIKRLAVIADSSADAMMCVDLEGCFEFWNVGAEILFGYKKDEVLGKDYHMIVPPELCSEADIKRSEALRKGYVRYETQRLAKDGTLFPVDMTLTLIKDEDGKPMGIAGSLKDLTEHKKLEEDYKDLFDNAKDGISLTDRNGNILLFNRRFRELTGYLDEELKGLHFSKLINSLDRDKALVYDKKRLRGMESPRTYEFRLQRRDGSAVDVEVTATPVVRNGSVVGTQGILRDLSEREVLLQEIRETRDHLESIYDTIEESICVLGRNLEIISFNEAFAKNVGVPRDRILGNKCYKVIHGYSLQDFENECKSRCIVQTAFEKGEPAESIHSHRFNGNVVYHESKALPTKNNLGETYQVVYVINDVTKRKTAEEGLQKTNNLLDIISRAQSQFIKEENRTALFEGLLQSLLELTESEYGFIGEVMLEGGIPFLKSLFITDVSWDEQTRKIYDEHKKSGMEFRNLDNLFGEVIKTAKTVISNNPSKDKRSKGVPHGHPAIHSFLGLPILGGENLLGMIGVANRRGGYDEALVEFLTPYLSTCAGLIEAMRTEEMRRKAEEELRFLAKIQDQISELIITLDKDKHIMTLNPAARIVLGYDEGELIGRDVSIIVPEDQRKNSIDFWKKLQKDGFVSTHEGVRVSKTGKRIPMELSGVLVKGDGTVPPYVIGVARDITERKKAEEELTRYALDLERSNKLKDLFADIMRHDLLNPVGIIKNVVELLEEEVESERFEKELAMINRNLKKMEELIDSASRFSQVESADKLEFASKDLREIMEASVESVNKAFKGRDFSIKLSEGKFIADVNIFIEDVFTNLLSNAVKYSPDGKEITITVDDEVGEWMVKISDRGPGVPEQHRETIFERFKRIEKGSVKGSGLGLAIVKKVLELHNGKIMVEDNPGGGSVFIFTIPKKRSRNV